MDGISCRMVTNRCPGFGGLGVWAYGRQGVPGQDRCKLTQLHCAAMGAPLAEEPRPALPAGPSAGGGGGAGRVPGILTPPPWPELEGTATPSQPQPCGRHLGDFCPMSEHHYNLFHACLNFKFIFSFNFWRGT